MSNYISPDSFFRSTVGKKIDIDGFPKWQPYQCYDPFALYCRKAFNFTPYCRPTGYAKDLANLQKTGLDKYFTKVPLSQARDGDWLVYGNASATPLSHIAMFRKRQGGMAVALQQNAPRPYVTQNLITLNGVIAVLRPKVSAHKPAPKPKKSALQVAKEIIRLPNFGGWGTGDVRVARLKKAGYNPSEVQKNINNLLR